MPGIVGIATKIPREKAERELRCMVEALRHEPFYETGVWIDESMGLYLGWCIDRESFAAGMPLANETGDLILIFSGEEFPDPDRRSRLKNDGHLFDPVGPSYLVHAAEGDSRFPSTLNGRFAGVLIDRRQGVATLFNDRYGMHRIYYHEAKEGFYFAAEAKAILAVQPDQRRIDPRGLGELISCGCVLEDRTLFHGLRILPGAAEWRLRGGALECRNTYFHPHEWENQARLEPEAYYDQLREVFSRILPRYFEGEQRVGMSLTGGLDTRMIMAWQRQKPGALPCYTFGGPLRDSQDVVIARRVAALCQQPHRVLSVDDKFFSRFGDYATRSVYLTDGCVGTNLCPDLYIYEQAREIAPVRMSGNYGGEVLRRVRAFKPWEPAPGVFQPELVTQIETARQTYAQVIQEHPLTFAVFRQAPWYHFGILALEQTQLTLRTPYLDNEFVRTVFRAPDVACATNDVCLRLVGEGSRALRRIRTDRGVGGNGRLFSTASRAILEFLFKAEYAYDYGMPQWVAGVDYHLSRLHLERIWLGRHKAYHFRIWFQHQLSQYVRETLLDSRSLSRSYVDRRSLTTLVERHVSGRRNYTNELHKLLTVELVHRLFVDQPRQAFLPLSR